jgi:hypothetical protein
MLLLISGNSIIQRGVHITSCRKQANIYESLVIYSLCRDAKREVLKNKGKSAKTITDSIIVKHFASNRGMKLVNRNKSVNQLTWVGIFTYFLP